MLANWMHNNCRKEQTMRILFSDEMFDLNGMYNSQSDIILAVNRAEADDKGGIKQIEKFP